MTIMDAKRLNEIKHHAEFMRAGRQPETIRDGDVIPTWCSKCHEATDHQYRHNAKGAKLACLRCESEANNGEQAKHQAQVLRR